MTTSRSRSAGSSPRCWPRASTASSGSRRRWVRSACSAASAGSRSAASMNAAISRGNGVCSSSATKADSSCGEVAARVAGVGHRQRLEGRVHRVDQQGAGAGPVPVDAWPCWRRPAGRHASIVKPASPLSSSTSRAACSTRCRAPAPREIGCRSAIASPPSARYRIVQRNGSVSMWGDSVTRSVTATASVNPPVVAYRAYWTVTAVVVGEAAIGGTMDLLRMAPFYPVLHRPRLSRLPVDDPRRREGRRPRWSSPSPGLRAAEGVGVRRGADQHGRRDGLAPGRARLARQPASPRPRSPCWRCCPGPRGRPAAGSEPSGPPVGSSIRAASARQQHGQRGRAEQGDRRGRAAVAGRVPGAAPRRPANPTPDAAGCRRAPASRARRSVPTGAAVRGSAKPQSSSRPACSGDVVRLVLAVHHRDDQPPVRRAWPRR